MPRPLGFWIATGLFCALFTFGGLSHLLRAEMQVEGMLHLGYPEYVMTILGVAKLLGVVALLVPGRLILKEWAYAGFAIDLVGATASHVFVGDPLMQTLPPIVVFGIGATSYALRPDDRRIVSSA